MLKVIALSGFLGSGKTTLVKHILTNSQGYRVAVILNDVSEMDIDTDLVKKAGIKFKKHQDIFQLSNGCVCCTLKDDMIKQVKKLAKSKKFDYLVIQATGVSTPLPVAQAFAYTPGIEKYAEVASMVTVVDAQNFQKNLISGQVVMEEEKQTGRKRLRRKKEEENNQRPTLAELMIDQLEIADLVIINKTDLVSNEKKQAVRRYITELSPESSILETQYSKIDLSEVFKKRFNLEHAEFSSKWIAEKQKTQDIPQTIKYNISSFIYRQRRPFDPQRLHQLIHSQKYSDFWDKITRSKGFVWLANYPRFEFQLHKAGKRVLFNLEQPWYIEMPKKHWVNEKEQLEIFNEFLSKYWTQPHGDKRIEMVFISRDLNQKQIREVLDKCLVAQDIMPDYEKVYKNIADPFKADYMKQWRQATTFFEQNQMLLDNDEEWEEVDEFGQSDDDDSDEQEQTQQAKKTKAKETTESKSKDAVEETKA